MIQMNKDSFAKWLETHSNLKLYSIGRCSKAIDTVSSELENYELPGNKYIYIILTNPEFKKKND